MSTANSYLTVAGIGVSGTATPANAADMIYAPVGTTGAAPWAALTAFSTSSITTVKNYAVGIFDKNGQPWWDVKGGK